MITPNPQLPLLLLLAIANTDCSSEPRQISIVDVKPDADRNFVKEYFGSSRTDIEPGKYGFFYTGNMNIAGTVRFIKSVSVFPDYVLDVSTDTNEEFVLLWRLPNVLP